MAERKKMPMKFKLVSVKTKEDDLENKVYTFRAADTLPDRTESVNQHGEAVDGEILSRRVLERAAEHINNREVMGGEKGSYRMVSLFHDRFREKDFSKEEAAYLVPGSAVVREIAESPGNYELLVDVEINKYYQPTTYPDYTPEKIQYKIEKDALGLSIEYNNSPEMEKVVEDSSGKRYNYVLDMDRFYGFGLARPNLIGNPRAVRIKEMEISKKLKQKRGRKTMEDEKMKEMAAKIADLETKNKELEGKIKEAETKDNGDELAKLKEAMEANIKEIADLKVNSNEWTAKMKEDLSNVFKSIEVRGPAKVKESDYSAKLKEVYEPVSDYDYGKFKERALSALEAKEGYGAHLKETMSRGGRGFDFEKWQTLQVKCKGSQMVVVPSAKTKGMIDSTDMEQTDYYETNAMFADRYVAGITETFLKEDSLLKVLPKEQHIGGNDRYQWRIWTEYETVTGDSTLSVNPDNTAVATSQRDFIKLGTRICEYRDAVQVTDFVQAHSMAAIGDLMGLELMRAAEAVRESMNADLFKGKTDGSSGWYGFIGLLGVADSSTYTSLYGKTRSATNRLLDSTTANTYVTAAESISMSVVRKGYEKVLANGSNLGDLVIVMHPTQCRKLFDSEDAAIRYQKGELSYNAAPPSWGFDRGLIPYIDGIPVIRDYRCESSASAADMFAVVDLSTDKGFNLIVSKPLSARGLAKVGTSEKAYVSFWGAAVYKSPRNIFVQDSLTT